MNQRLVVCGLTLVLLLGLPNQNACGNELLGGVSDIINGAIALPVDTLIGTVSGPPILGTVNGVLHGTFRALGTTARGIFRLVGVAIPLAGKVAPLIPVFL